jgi:UDP-N-acetylmuramoyl-tripeptide--D-alanyl-D-alanine ligase
VNIATAVVLSALLVLAYAAQMARWLRVLQREHYDPTSLLRFLSRWSSPQRPSAKASAGAKPRRPFTLSHALIVAMIVAIAFRAWDYLVVATALYGLFCPVGLSIRGRTSRLEWTRRLRTTASLATTLSVIVAGLAALAPHPYQGRSAAPSASLIKRCNDWRRCIRGSWLSPARMARRRRRTI